MDTLILNFTESCNSRCATCGIWRLREPKTLPLDLIEEVLASSYTKGLHNVYLTGGEPYLDAQCVGIARLVAAYHPFCFISGASNGLEPTNYLRRIQRMRRYVQVIPSVSLNGRPETHDTSRGIQGSYNRCLLLMKMFSHWSIPFNLAYLDFDQGWEDWEHVNRLAGEFGVEVVVTRKRGSARYATPYRPDPSFDFACRAPLEIACIWPSGDVTACEEDNPDLLIGNLYEQSLDEMDFDSVARYVRAGNCRPCSMGCFEGK